MYLISEIQIQRTRTQFSENKKMWWLIIIISEIDPIHTCRAHSKPEQHFMDLQPLLGPPSILSGTPRTGLVCCGYPESRSPWDSNTQHQWFLCFTTIVSLIWAGPSAVAAVQMVKINNSLYTCMPWCGPHLAPSYSLHWLILPSSCSAKGRL